MEQSLRLAVIGHPIAHTLSPIIQGKMMEKLKVKGDYQPYHVLPENLGEFVAFARTSLDGFNITIPHKSAILPFLSGISDYAKGCGAVNTVRIKDGLLYGYNTDGAGLSAALKTIGVSMAGSRIALLGAGGAALSICQKALMEGARSVTVFCRTPKKAEPLRKDDRVQILPFESLSAQTCGEVSDIIINSTPLGMSGIPDDFQDFSFLDGTQAALCDIVYKPAETSLLKECRRRGIRAVNGLPMLIYQAVYAFEIFSGLSFDKDEMAAFLIEEMDAYLNPKGTL